MSDKYLKILCLLLFHTTFVYLDDGSGIGRVIQATCLGVLMIMMMIKHQLKLHPQYKKINTYVIAYCMALVLISYVNKDVDIDALNRLKLGSSTTDLRLSSYTLGIMMSLSVFTSFALIEHFATKGKIHILLMVFYRTLLFYLLISDIQMLLIGESGNEGYLVGNKFALSYMHILCYVFYERISQERKMCIWMKWFLIILSFTVSILTECTTALLGMLIVVLLLSSKSRIRTFVFKLKTYLIILFSGVFFIFFYSYILDIPLVQNIIVNVLHEDPTLTGRTGIYDLMATFMFTRPIWGLGIGNSHRVLSYLFGIANAQNGLMNLFVEEGLVGVILYFSLFFCIFKYTIKHAPYNYSYPILTYILVFFFLGLVEITIDNKLLIIMSFLLAVNNTNHNSTYAQS